MLVAPGATQKRTTAIGMTQIRDGATVILYRGIRFRENKAIVSRKILQCITGFVCRNLRTINVKNMACNLIRYVNCASHGQIAVHKIWDSAHKSLIISLRPVSLSETFIYFATFHMPISDAKPFILQKETKLLQSSDCC